MDFISELIAGILASWVRMLVALTISIAFSIIVGIAAATNRALERIILPFLDVLQTIPILGFFPIVIFLVVSAIPGYVGINVAVIFLIFTSMSWNISFGVYEAIKAIPQELGEIAMIYRFGFWERLSRIYIPASLPRIAYQSTISFSIGLFYLATSEIFSTGSKNFAVTYGIGVEIAKIAASASFPRVDYVLAIIMFVVAVILTRIFILEPFSLFSERFSLADNEDEKRRSVVLDLYLSSHALFGRILSKFRFRRPIHLEAMPRPRTPQIKKSYRLIKHKHFKHIYLTIAVLLVLLVEMLLMNTNLVYTEAVVLYALAISFIRVWATYIVCAAIAVPLGISIALSRRWFKPAVSVLQVLAAIPATILLPILIVLLSQTPYFGETTAFAVIFISMIWYLLFSVISGMRTIPASLGEAIKSNRLTWRQRWGALYVPAALPSFITGSITAIGGGWNSLIIAEYFVVQSTHSSQAAMGQVCMGASYYLNTAASGQAVLSQVGCGVGKLIDVAVFSGDIKLMLLAIVSMTLMVIIINRLFWQKVYNRVITRYKLEV